MDISVTVPRYEMPLTALAAKKLSHAQVHLPINAVRPRSQKGGG